MIIYDALASFVYIQNILCITVIVTVCVLLEKNDEIIDVFLLLSQSSNLKSLNPKAYTALTL